MAKIVWYLIVPMLAMLWLYAAYAAEPGAAHPAPLPPVTTAGPAP